MAKTERRERLYATAGAAVAAHLKPETIRHYIREGKLRAEKPIGGDDFIIREADLNAWLATRSKGKVMEKAADSSP